MPAQAGHKSKFVLSPLSPSLWQEDQLSNIYKAIFEKVVTESGQKDGSGQPLWPTVHHWLQSKYGTPEGQAELLRMLDGLELACREVLSLPPRGADVVSTVPERLTSESGHLKFKIPLTLIGFCEDAQVKGPVQSYAVRLRLQHRVRFTESVVTPCLSKVRQGETISRSSSRTRKGTRRTSSLWRSCSSLPTC